MRRFGAVLVALSQEGRPLGLGGRGPAWVIYPRDDDPELQQRDDALFVWGVVLSKVE